MSGSLYGKARGLGKSERLAIAGILALIGVCFFLNLGGLPLVGKDEPRYAEVAREMYASADWITPRLAGHTWFEKPALPYWLMAAAYATLGVSEFAARAGAALLGALAVASVYLAARRAWRPRAASFSALALTTSVLWFAFARAASFDMPLAATMAAALASLYAYDVAERGRVRWAAAAGAWAGASMLAKGLVGPVLLGAIAAAYLVATGAWRRVRLADLAACAGAAAGVAAVWYVPVYARNGWAFVDEFFVQHHFNRYLTNQFHHPAPWYFYLLVVAAGLLPWTFALAAGAGRLAGVLRRRPATDGERLVWLAALTVAVPLAFFSLSTSKLPGYILPVFPGLALLVGWTLEGIARDGRGRWSLVAGAVTAMLLAAGIAVYLLGSGAPVAALAVFLLPIGIALAAARQRRAPARAVASIALSMGLVVAALSLLFFPLVGDAVSLHRLSRAAGAQLHEGEVVVPYGLTEYGPAFYAQGRMAVDERGEILIADSIDQVVAVAAGSPTRSALCITPEDAAGQLAADGRLEVAPIASQSSRDEFREHAATLVRVTLR